MGESVREIRATHQKFLVQKGKEARELRGRVTRKYMGAITNGKTDREAQDFCLECFDQEGLTQRRLNNILDKKAEFGNANANAITEARVLNWLGRQAELIQEDISHFDEVLDDIDEKFYAGEKWYEMEEVETIEGIRVLEADGETTKSSGLAGKETVRIRRIPILEIKGVYLKRRAEALDRFFVAIKNLRGNQQIVNIVNTNGASLQTLEDLGEQIKILEKQHRIESEAPPETPQE